MWEGKKFLSDQPWGSSIFKIIPVRQNQGVCCAFCCKHEFKDRWISMCISGRGQKWGHATVTLSSLAMLPLRLWSVCFKLPPTLDLHLSELIQISINKPIVNVKVYDRVQRRLHQETNKSKLNTDSTVVVCTFCTVPSSLVLMPLVGTLMNFLEICIGCWRILQIVENITEYQLKPNP